MPFLLPPFSSHLKISILCSEGPPWGSSQTARSLCLFSSQRLTPSEVTFFVCWEVNSLGQGPVLPVCDLVSRAHPSAHIHSSIYHINKPQTGGSSGERKGHLSIPNSCEKGPAEALPGEGSREGSFSEYWGAPDEAPTQDLVPREKHINELSAVSIDGGGEGSWFQMRRVQWERSSLRLGKDSSLITLISG